MNKSTNTTAKAMFHKHKKVMKNNSYERDFGWNSLARAERRAWRALAKDQAIMLAEKEREILRYFGVEGV